jgi:hypothetical protein
MSYGWPVEPFGEQHPVRGFFGDPRVGSAGGTSFHFGIDVSVPNGTPVYAVAAGTAHLDVAGGPENIAVAGPAVTHGYWHVHPAVTDGQHVTEGALLGHVAAPWQHVHFAERTPAGPYLNPLREGALAPFAKHEPPSVDRIVVEAAGSSLDSNALTGTVDLIVQTHDTTPIEPLAPYAHMPVVPALVRWRLVAHENEIVPWRTVADFRDSKPDNSLYNSVYAHGTAQNHPPKPGLYRFQLASDFDTRAHPDGSYRIDVEVADTRGNNARGHLTVELANGQV